MEYLKKHARPAGSEKGMDLAGKALTQKSDRPRSTWGSLLMTAQDIKGLCSTDRKCFRRDGHSGHHYPKTTTQAEGG